MTTGRRRHTAMLWSWKHNESGTMQVTWHRTLHILFFRHVHLFQDLAVAYYSSRSYSTSRVRTRSQK
jgi:hypothetical protein